MKGLKDPEMRPTHTIQLTELLQFSNEVKSFKKGAYIFQEGMLAKNMYLILSGKVKVSKSTADGRELTLRLCSENDIVGEAVFFHTRLITYSLPKLLKMLKLLSFQRNGLKKKSCKTVLLPTNL